ncbi:MAG: class I SAM-dependent methyltransferase [Polyangiaceae bacterium]|nr:class I SAM-dependent methyltransferase [Polyangiaceae bacterium]MCW5790295.1 class I SAM-dependent methyltransferase [Polyangiaceae bacterium]
MTDTPQVEPGHYEDASYDTRERFLTYWHQADEVRQRRPQNMLEVGIGNGFLHRYLRARGVDVHTLDFDERLGPDTVGSVLQLPFEDGQFDLVCCYETLEHLPWEHFSPALEELRRVGRRWVLLSLPDVTPYARFDIEVTKPGKRRTVRKLVELRGKAPVHQFDGQHYWEIGKRGWPVRRITSLLEGAGLEVEADFRVFGLPYHHFFSTRIR